MPSSAPVVKANLLTILRARAGLSGVTIEWAIPSTFAGQEYIWLGKVHDQEKAVALGRQSRDEAYTVEVIVWNVQDGDDPQTAEARWWALAGEVESAVQSDPQLSSAVSQWAIVKGIEQSPFTSPGQRGSEGVVLIECHNRK